MCKFLQLETFSSSVEFSNEIYEINTRMFFRKDAREYRTRKKLIKSNKLKFAYVRKLYNKTEKHFLHQTMNKIIHTFL